VCCTRPDLAAIEGYGLGMSAGSDVAERLRTAMEARDLDALGGLLTDDVRWGDGDQPRACRSRRDVVETFRRLMSEGVNADVDDPIVGEHGIMVGLQLKWPDGDQRSRRVRIYQVYMLRDAQISEIRGFDDRESALLAAGA
jgi:hypothetical protein